MRPTYSFRSFESNVMHRVNMLFSAMFLLFAMSSLVRNRYVVGLMSTCLS